MTADSTTTAQVANPYKAALARALGQARPVAAEAATNLDQAVGSMRGQAWVSTTADDFFTALTAHDKTAKNAGQASVDEIQRAHDAQPDKVEPMAWQTRWSRMM